MRLSGLGRSLGVVAALAAGCSPPCAPSDAACVELHVEGGGSFTDLDVFLTHRLINNTMQMRRRRAAGFDVDGLPLNRRLRLPESLTPSTVYAFAAVATDRISGVQAGGSAVGPGWDVSPLPGSDGERLAVSVPVRFAFARRDVAVGGPQLHAVAADINQDGTPDLLTVHDYPQDQLRLTFLGPDGGQRGAPLVQPVQPQPRRIAVGQINHDGRPDVAVASVFGTYVLGGGANNVIAATNQIRFGLGQPDGTLGGFVDRGFDVNGMASPAGWRHLLLIDVNESEAGCPPRPASQGRGTGARHYRRRGAGVTRGDGSCQKSAARRRVSAGLRCENSWLGFR